MATENFNEFLKRIKEHPYSFGEYDGDDSYENENNDEDIDIPADKESLFEKYKKGLDKEADK